MAEVVQLATARPRFTLVVLATFACVALVLAAVGIYGVMSYAVSRRRHEIGVRLALGAAQGVVVRMIVREGMTVALTGTAVGLAAALLLTRSMASLLYGVTATDPLTFGVVSLTLLGVALFATYLPARAAARTDPLTTLRTE
jgi:putative ABC transport system permease protein